MPKLLNTALDFMGFLTTNEEAIEDDSIRDTRQIMNDEKIVSLHPKALKQTIVHLNPKVFDDVLGIAKRLQNKKIVTMNLQLVEGALRNRMIDFLSGSVYALNGGIMQLGDNVYLLAVQGVTLKERPRDSLKFAWRKGSK